jgi:hypothetical protein
MGDGAIPKVSPAQQKQLDDVELYMGGTSSTAPANAAPPADGYQAPKATPVSLEGGNAQATSEAALAETLQGSPVLQDPEGTHNVDPGLAARAIVSGFMKVGLPHVWNSVGNSQRIPVTPQMLARADKAVAALPAGQRAMAQVGVDAMRSHGYVNRDGFRKVFDAVGKESAQYADEAGKALSFARVGALGLKALPFVGGAISLAHSTKDLVSGVKGGASIFEHLVNVAHVATSVMGFFIPGMGLAGDVGKLVLDGADLVGHDGGTK